MENDSRYDPEEKAIRIVDNLIDCETKNKVFGSRFHIPFNIIDSFSINLALDLKKFYKEGRANFGSTSANQLNVISRSKHYLLFLLNSIEKSLLCLKGRLDRYPNKGETWFCENYGNNLAISIDVAQLLQKEGKPINHLFHRRLKTTEAYDGGGKVFRIEQFGRSSVIGKKKIEACFEQFWNCFHTQFSEEVECSTSDLNFIRDRLYYFINLFFCYYSRCLTFISVASPVKLIFTSDSILQNRILLLIGRTHNIPSYTIQHGFIRNSKTLKYIICNYYLVWGSFYRSLIIDNNSRVICKVTGSLKHYNLQKRFTQVKPNTGKVLFATTPSSGNVIGRTEYLEAISSLLDVASKLKSIQLFIKPHPADNVELLGDLIADYRCANTHLLDKNTDIYYHLATSELLIFVGSTLSLESLYFKRPVLCINYDFFDNRYPYSYHEGYSEAKKPTDLNRLIMNSLQNGKSKNWDVKEFIDNENPNLKLIHALT